MRATSREPFAPMRYVLQKRGFNCSEVQFHRFALRFDSSLIRKLLSLSVLPAPTQLPAILASKLVISWACCSYIFRISYPM